MGAARGVAHRQLDAGRQPDGRDALVPAVGWTQRRSIATGGASPAAHSSGSRSTAGAKRVYCCEPKTAQLTSKPEPTFPCAAQWLSCASACSTPSDADDAVRDTERGRATSGGSDDSLGDDDDPVRDTVADGGAGGVRDDFEPSAASSSIAPNAWSSAATSEVTSVADEPSPVFLRELAVGARRRRQQRHGSARSDAAVRTRRAPRAVGRALRVERVVGGEHDLERADAAAAKIDEAVAARRS